MTVDYQISHRIPGRIRVRLAQCSLSDGQADCLEMHLRAQAGIRSVKIYERTAGVAIVHENCEASVLRTLRQFTFENDGHRGTFPASTRKVDRMFREKLSMSIVTYAAMRLFAPPPLRSIHTVIKSVRYIRSALSALSHKKLTVDVLDGTAVTVSLARGDFQTAGSIMFMLGIGSMLEEWTHKKSVGDLAGRLSLNVSRVWVKNPVTGREELKDAKFVGVHDIVVVRAGHIVPFDGTVYEGEGMIDQSSLTGEPVPAEKRAGAQVYAGTVLTEGEIHVDVRNTSGSSRYEKILSMIEETEQLKSSAESRAENLADRLVPYTLGGTALVWLLTKNITKALTVLMVDFSCTMKLATPIAVLSAIREASEYEITVKGGKFLEAAAKSDTIVFDKTGTITKATPVVRKVVPFIDHVPDLWTCPGAHVQDELLRIAACLEEHFPHSMAKAVVHAAKERGLDHEELHSKVNYIVAHGISSAIGEHKIVIGSEHFIFEDEQASIPDHKRHILHQIESEYSRLYMAIDGRLAAVICIEDPIRSEARTMIRSLRERGVQRIVMMTGDNRHTAKKIAQQVGIDEVYAEVLPHEKAGFVKKEKMNGRTVMMVGDGVNDSPALSAADVGVALSDGSELAREIADMTIASDDLRELVRLRDLSCALLRRVDTHYRWIIGINTGLIGLGLSGVITPSVSALLHNASTLWIGTRSMRPLLPDTEFPNAAETKPQSVNVLL